jgi:hypothetical protein
MNIKAVQEYRFCRNNSNNKHVSRHNVNILFISHIKHFVLFVECVLALLNCVSSSSIFHNDVIDISSTSLNMRDQYSLLEFRMNV